MRGMLSFALLGLAIACPAAAVERETLLPENVVHGFFGGPEARISAINGGANLLLGAKGAWLIDHTYYVGGAGFHTVRDIKDTDLRLGYGGLVLGVFREPSKQIHSYIELLVGAGALGEPDNPHHSGAVHKRDSVFVVEPAVGVTVNLGQFVTLNSGLSYRMIEGSDIAEVSDSGFSGLSLHVNAMFGRF